MEKRPALGKGLSALIPDVPEVRTGGASAEADVDQIFPNQHQPRHHFEDSRLDEPRIDQGERRHSADRRAQGG